MQPRPHARPTAGFENPVSPAGSTNPDDDPNPAAPSRVVKTLQPGQPGTGRWHHAYGDQLVCVRYREDLARRERYVTVELRLETRPLVRRAPADERPTAPPRDSSETVGVRIGIGERLERSQAREAGAYWDPIARLWHMRRLAAEQLGWHHRIEPLP